MIAVKKKDQTVSGSLVMDIPTVLRLRTVTMKLSDPNKDAAIKIAMEINHRVIPAPEPGIACGKALKGG